MSNLIFLFAPSALKCFSISSSFSCWSSSPPAHEQAGQSLQKDVYLPVLDPGSPSLNTVSCYIPPLYTGLSAPKPRDLPMANTDSGSPICLSLLAFFFLFVSMQDLDRFSGLSLPQAVHLNRISDPLFNRLYCRK